MKLILLLIITYFSLPTKAQQNLLGHSQENTEAYFYNFFKRGAFQGLHKSDLGSTGFSKIQYYKYKILKKDSVVFYSLNNPKIKMVDSIVELAFRNAVDSVINFRELNYLIHDSYTYIPLIILYKTNPNERLNEKISIAPIEDIFSWEYDTESKKPEIIYRSLSPFIFRLPAKKTQSWKKL